MAIQTLKNVESLCLVHVYIRDPSFSCQGCHGPSIGIQKIGVVEASIDSHCRSREIASAFVTNDPSRIVRDHSVPLSDEKIGPSPKFDFLATDCVRTE